MKKFGLIVLGLLLITATSCKKEVFYPNIPDFEENATITKSCSAEDIGSLGNQPNDSGATSTDKIPNTPSVTPMPVDGDSFVGDGITDPDKDDDEIRRVKIRPSKS